MSIMWYIYNVKIEIWRKKFLGNSFVVGIILDSIILIIMEALNLFLLGLICSSLLFSLIVIIGICLEYKMK